jgi:hypothetical protein
VMVFIGNRPSSALYPKPYTDLPQGKRAWKHLGSFCSNTRSYSARDEPTPIIFKRSSFGHRTSNMKC